MQIDFPFHHDLDALRRLIPEDWNIKKFKSDLAELTEWAVESRYPGDWPDIHPSDARSTLELAECVWSLIFNDFEMHGHNAIRLLN